MMSDFAKTMRDWQRMCDSMNKHGDGCCINCPLRDGVTCGGIWEMPENTNWQLLQEKVAAWAAENPEPQYPTWLEWLTEQGVISAGGPRNRAFAPIPADIAEKLGLKPKGEGNGV